MFGKINTWMRKYASEIVRAGMVSLLISGTVLCAVLTVFFANISEFSFTFRDLAGPLMAGFLLLFLFLFILQGAFRFAGEKIFSVVNLLFFVIGVYLFILSNILIWDIGTMMGQDFWWDWREHGMYTFIELTCLIVLAFLFWRDREWFSKHIVFPCGLLLLFGFIWPSYLMLTVTGESEFSYKNYVIDRTDEFRFGKERNVILLILDAYPNVLLDVEEEKYPGTWRALRDFTRYQRCLCENPATVYGMPALLAGIQIPPVDLNSEEYTQIIQKIYYAENSIPKRLREMGFRVENYYIPCALPGAVFLHHDKSLLSNIRHKSEVEKDSSIFLPRHRPSVQLLADATILRLMPIRIKGFMVRFVSSLRNSFFRSDSEEPDGDFIFYNGIQKGVEIGDAKNVFKYYHLSGVHGPYQMDENCAPHPGTSLDGYLRQGKACMKMVSLFLEQLKKEGIYDNSLIIIAGDHGREEKFFGLSELPHGMNPLFLVKMPNETHETMQENNDVLPQTEVAPALIAAVSQNSRGNTLFFAPSESQKKLFEEQWNKKIHSHDDSVWNRQKLVFSNSLNETIAIPEQLGQEVTCYVRANYFLNNHLVGFVIIPSKPDKGVVLAYLEDSQGNRFGGESLKVYNFNALYSWGFQIGLSPELPDEEYTLYFRYQIDDEWKYSKYPKTLKKLGNDFIFAESRLAGSSERSE
ncbi:MAG: sulfatase-like hydrolase/transferase [Planctomycetia bacterium]|nr:sulfatase-like hydrolase/transferase [Planctomycetia bacterium]